MCHASCHLLLAAAATISLAALIAAGHVQAHGGGWVSRTADSTGNAVSETASTVGDAVENMGQATGEAVESAGDATGTAVGKRC